MGRVAARIDDYMFAAPVPDTELDADTGWLSPDGKLYPCHPCEHEQLAARLGLNTRAAHNWIHLSEGDWHSPHVLARLRDLQAPPYAITQAQIDTIFDWTTKRGLPMPFWLRKMHP